MLGVLFHIRYHATLLALKLVDELEIVSLNLLEVRFKHFQNLKV